jgi:hypothetical protein
VRRYVVLRSRVLLATPTARPASWARDAAPPSPEGFTWDVHPNAINTETACPDLHANRTSCGHRATAAFDPKRTWLNNFLDHPVGDGWFASHRNCSAEPFLPAAEADADTTHDDDIGPRVDRSV